MASTDQKPVLFANHDSGIAGNYIIKKGMILFETEDDRKEFLKEFGSSGNFRLDTARNTVSVDAQLSDSELVVKQSDEIAELKKLLAAKSLVTSK